MLVTQSCLALGTPWTITHQAPLPWDFPGKNSGLGCHFLLQGNLPDPGIEPKSPALQADSLLPELQGKPSLGKMKKKGGEVVLYLESGTEIVGLI